MYTQHVTYIRQKEIEVKIVHYELRKINRLLSLCSFNCLKIEIGIDLSKAAMQHWLYLIFCFGREFILK
jgi:hypothetical protein